MYPLKQTTLREVGLYTRGPDPSSTEFSLTRFLAPYLAAFEGWSIFLDCDFLLTRDIFDLLPALDESKALHCVKHDYKPAQKIKMDAKHQTAYPRKNWSSFMVFNGRHPSVKALTPSVVNTATPAYLHRFQWLEEMDIGSLNPHWNFLVGEYPTPAALPAAIHYTNGGPWLNNYRTTDFASEWEAEHHMLELESSTETRVVTMTS